MIEIQMRGVRTIEWFVDLAWEREWVKWLSRKTFARVRGG